MEAVWDCNGNLSTPKFRHGLRIEHQQERALGACVKHNGEKDSFVLTACPWPGNKHGLTGETAILKPGRTFPVDHIDFDQLIVKGFRQV